MEKRVGDAGGQLRCGAARAAGRGAGGPGDRGAGAAYRGRPRRGHPGRPAAHRDAVRAQPDRGVALARRIRRAGRLRGRGDRAGRRAAGAGRMTEEIRRWHAELAWLGAGEVQAGVLIEAAGPVLRTVTPGVAAAALPPGTQRLAGLTLPGLANAHSHAFHRALRGVTEQGQGTFWTWREQMYQVAGRLTPDSYLALARAVYAEMALAGVTCVGEFHYVHHQPDGTPYADPNAMGHALIQAAAEAGLRITLLDTCYLTGGLTEDGSS